MHTNPVEIPTDIKRKYAQQNAFPSARYFQIHFDYLHELLGDMKNQLEVSNQKISVLQQQLSKIVPAVVDEIHQ
ncbi:MAG: hypothetical protein QX197_15150 [Methylococcaceae bacterium]